jgi:hypothetical protein
LGCDAIRLVFFQFLAPVVIWQQVIIGFKCLCSNGLSLAAFGGVLGREWGFGKKSFDGFPEAQGGYRLRSGLCIGNNFCGLHGYWALVFWRFGQRSADAVPAMGDAFVDCRRGIAG